MAKKVLSVDNLSKKFGKFTAVKSISFDIAQGEIVGLLGPNGAGKTTTIQMLLGLMKPTQGNISYFSKSLEENRVEILNKINYMSGYSKMPWRLTVWENLVVFAHLYNTVDAKQKIERLAEIFEVTEFLHKKFQDLSAGQVTRSLLIKAFINDPELVLLDEPTASLDPDIADKIRKFILEERDKRSISILITSHNMAEVEEMCDRVVFLHRGKVLAIDTPEGLAQKNSMSELKLMVSDGLKRLIEFAGKKKYQYEEKKRFINIKLPETDIASFLNEMGERGLKYSEIEIVRPSLEDFFLQVSKGEKHEY